MKTLIYGIHFWSQGFLLVFPITLSFQSLKIISHNNCIPPPKKNWLIHKNKWYELKQQKCGIVKRICGLATRILELLCIKGLRLIRYLSQWQQYRSSYKIVFSI